MRILAAAKAGFDYNRTSVLLKGLESLGHEVDIFKIPDRNITYGRELSFRSASADVVYVPPFRHRDLSFVRKFSQAPVVFDPLISRYLTKVVDYGHYWKAPQKWLIDYRDFRNCDLLISDTQAHLNYFKKTFFLPPTLPTAVIPVGVNIDDYKKSEQKKGEPFTVGFYGTFVPLQGTTTIIESIASLKEFPDINFKLIGTGYQYEEARKLAAAKGLSMDIFEGWVPYEELPNRLSHFDLALGVFGQSLKADFVVPNKLFHYAALGIPCLTKSSIGIAEIFTPGENVFTCEANPEAMAEAILQIKKDPIRLKATGQKAQDLITKSYSHRSVAQLFIDAVQQSGLV